jgi:transketolase C-terminal domain/subunit
MEDKRYIAEQNMVGTGLGLAACGKIPYVATFACFLTCAADFILPHSRRKRSAIQPLDS